MNFAANICLPKKLTYDIYFCEKAARVCVRMKKYGKANKAVSYHMSWYRLLKVSQMLKTWIENVMKCLSNILKSELCKYSNT